MSQTNTLCKLFINGIFIAILVIFLDDDEYDEYNQRIHT